MSVDLSLALSSLSVFFAILFGALNLLRAEKKSEKSSTAQMTTVIVKLENICSVCNEIKSELSTVKSELASLSVRLADAEQSLRSAWKQIELIEREAVFCRSQGKEEH